MNITPSTARLTNIDLANTVANADKTRSKAEFSNSLNRAHRDTVHFTPPAVHDRKPPIANAVAKAEVTTVSPLSPPEPVTEPVSTPTPPSPSSETTAKTEAPPPPPTPSADLNNDGQVNVLDFGLFTKAFGSDNANADLFQDGTVDDLDFAIFKELFSRST